MIYYDLSVLLSLVHVRAWITCRLEQCDALTELLKRFQSIRGELSGTLQRAESTVREQASYMGKDNLQRLHTKVQASTLFNQVIKKEIVLLN